ncbi:MAG: RsmB/NOP family class I SAM-dependent RNA methyltransferase, partial [Rhodospirillaceae bacterium]|nr:RsmB/NOP family class I SAM-dependent RNA methyltransferase [Rhodospirillaceae bacterium]
MTPGGRLQAVIEALDMARMEDRPADRVLHDFLRDRRYIGSGDRRAVSDLFWKVMRYRARLAADCALAEGRNLTDAVVRAESGRRLVMALCVQEKKVGDVDLALFTGEAYAPEVLSTRDQDWITTLRQVKTSERPEWAWAETPEWLWPRFLEIYGDNREAEIAAARTEGSVDLRVNTLKADRDAVAARLAAEGIATKPMRFSPLGLRCVERSNVAATVTFKDGAVEVQDESAQLAALLVDARHGETVVDFCAGAGGKTLALSAAMGNSGRLIACDVAQARLDRSAIRLRRAGAFNVTRRALSGETDKWVKRHKGTADRVLVDAPCSGSGTWRRNPDARWRFRPEGLVELTALQARILNSAARLVRPGGRL